MARGPQLPTLDELADIACDVGLHLGADELETYRTLMGGALGACRRVDELADENPAPVRYPRGAWHRPPADENPYNAWRVRTRIDGAAEGTLAGLELAVKDSICVAGIPAMNGSAVLEGYVPDVDATIVTRLLDAGARVVGKTNCEDLCFAGHSQTCFNGPVLNPHKPTHATGGSSSGSGAVIAAGDVPMALGGDQGGSIRIPSAWCGVYGLKPSYGLVPYT
ncbi:MAG: amidase, partial [Gammaproteobacteria bacterium]|nr:amidase [Gammaproteobacteria bacterium]